MSSRRVRAPHMSREAREARREQTASALGERLRAADQEMDVPEGLWERIRAQDAGGESPPTAHSPPASSPREHLAPAPVRVRGRRPGPLVVTAVAAGAVVLIATGAWWLATGSRSAPSPGPSAPPAGEPEVTLSVHNSESACRSLRTLECALRLAENPHDRYAATGNSSGRVWHGDRLTAICTVTDGTLVKDESGISSTRWYLVRSGEGKEGWLPGVRTRNSSEVRTCSDAEESRIVK